MTIKEFGEDAEVFYELQVSVNRNKACVISAYSQESLIEQLHKVDHAVSNEITKQFEELPEPIEDETRGYADY